MGHPSRHRVLVALLMALFVLVTGCGGGTQELPKAQPPSTSPSPIDPGVKVVGLDPTELDVTDTTGVSPGSSLSFASPIYSLTASAELSGPTKVQLLLDNALPRTSPVFVVTRLAADKPWTYLPARLMSDQRHVEFTTSHLSDFGVLVMDVDGALTTFRADVRARLNSGLNRKVKKPECAEPAEARKDGYSVVATPGKKTLFWCFGLENGKRVLKVVNRRVVPIQVGHAAAPEIDPATPPKGWATWARVLGNDATFLAPGRSATYDADLEPVKRLLLRATSDSTAQSLQVFQATVGAVVAAVTNFGGKSSTANMVDALLARPQCAKTLGLGSDKMLAACFSRRKVIATWGSRGLLLARLTTAPTTAAFLRVQFKAIATGVVGSTNESILVRRAKPDFTGFVGTFTGKARLMSVNAEGLVFESVSNVTAKGVVTPVADVTYQLSEPRTEKGVSTAQAVITKVKIYDRKAFRGTVPRVGQTGSFRLDKGVVRSPFVLRTYCDGKAAKKGTCG
jgi:hypothetical protein